jgi:hypothetical protein
MPNMGCIQIGSGAGEARGAWRQHAPPREAGYLHDTGGADGLHNSDPAPDFVCDYRTIPHSRDRVSRDRDAAIVRLLTPAEPHRARTARRQRSLY